MARKNMPTASNARKVSRPAQGRRTDTPFNRPAPAYLKSNGAPHIVGMGSVSKPKDIPNRFAGKRLVVDATPKVVQL